MFESVLFIVTGVAFYGGAHQLYLGTRSHTGHPHVVHAAMFFLLAGFATASALTSNSQSIAELSGYGKFAVSMGMLLFGMLPWLVVLCTRYRVLVIPALLTVAWSTLLLLNLGSISSLLYQEINPLAQTLPSGQIQVTLHTLASPWWRVVELAMFSTLIFSLYVSYQYYRRGNKQVALALTTALLVLLCTTLADLLINAEVLESAYLAPLGFLAFLLISGVFTYAPPEQDEGRLNEQPQPSYQLTLNLNQSSTRRERPVPWSRDGDTEVRSAAEADQAELTHQETGPAFSFIEKQSISPMPEPVVLESQQPPASTSTPAQHSTEGCTTDTAPKSAPPTRFDSQTIDEVSDSLVDIAVHATMILNRLQRGDTDTEALETLSRKVRSRAIETRRITHRMRRAEKDSRPE